MTEATQLNDQVAPGITWRLVILHHLGGVLGLSDNMALGAIGDWHVNIVPRNC